MNKLYFVLFISFLISSISSANESSFEDLKDMFERGIPATEAELSGAFVGNCYINPVVGAYANAEGINYFSGTMSNLLLGKQIKNEMHVVMIINPSIQINTEKTPGSQIQSYIEDYKRNKNRYLDMAISTPALSKKSDGSLATSIDLAAIGYQVTHTFRVFNGGLIATVAGESDAPPALQGTQAVCYWYQKLE